MLPDHLGELEPVQIRHADVHQNNGNLVLEQLFERLLAGRGLDQLLSQILENHLVCHQFGRVIIDQQDADFLVWVACHSALHFQRCSHMRRAESNCSVLTGFAR